MYAQLFVRRKVKLRRKKKKITREQLLNEMLILFLHIQEKIQTRSMQLKHILIISLTLD